MDQLKPLTLLKDSQRKDPSCARMIKGANPGNNGLRTLLWFD
jgi:hypothetical protein